MNDEIIGLGIDQGIANCGYSIVSYRRGEFRILESGTIITRSTYPLTQRIEILHTRLNELILNHQVHVIGCEKLFFNSFGAGQRNKSASIVYTNMITGVIYLLAGRYRLPIKEFVPGTVKKVLTGNGRATKEEVEQAVLKLFKQYRGEDVVADSHEFDSIGIGMTTVKYFANNYTKMLAEHRFIKPRKQKRKE